MKQGSRVTWKISRFHGISGAGVMPWFSASCFLFSIHLPPPPLQLELGLQLCCLWNRCQKRSTAAAGLRAVGLLVPAGDGGGGRRLCAWLGWGADRGRAVHDPEGKHCRVVEEQRKEEQEHGLSVLQLCKPACKMVRWGGEKPVMAFWYSHSCVKTGRGCGCPSPQASGTVVFLSWTNHPRVLTNWSWMAPGLLLF